MKLYYALVHKDKGSAYGITFPDLPGCFGASDEDGDLLSAAQEALMLYVEDEADVAAPRSLPELQRDCAISRELAAGAVLLAVPLIELERKGRYNVMLDVDLVAGIDRKARLLGVSRSEFLAESAGVRLKALGAGAARTVSSAKKPAAKKK